MSAEGEERGRLDGPPESMTRSEDRPRHTSARQPATSNFAFNRPTIISLLYFASFVFGVTAVVGVILAYVWRKEPHEDWEDSHYQYLINTFWIGLIGAMASFMLMLVLIGFLLLPLVLVLVVVRAVLSLVNAQKQSPMPNPDTLLA